MELKNLITTNKTITVEHPEFPGFMVDIAYISRELTSKLLKKATNIKYNNKTRRTEEEIDNELFLQLHTDALIKGWTGLKYRYLSDMLPVDLTIIEDNDEELEYTKENALDLIKNSVDFDSWVSNAASDVKNFNKSS